MAWALQFDGVNDYLNISRVTVAVGDSLIIKTKPLVGNSNGWYRLIGEQSGYSNLIELQSTKLLIRINGSSYNISTTQPPIGTFFELEIRRISPSSYEVYIDSSLVGSFSSSAGFNFDQIGAFNRANFYSGQFEFISVTNSHNWDATASNHGTGQPVLTDTIGGNDATGVNVPTDGSAWVDLGGGDTSIDVTTQTKTITYTVGQHTVEITGEVNTQSDTKTVNYAIGQHTVSLTGEVNATTDTKTVNYVIGQHSVELTGEVSVTTDTKTIDYLIGQHTVNLSGDIEVTSQSKQINYTIGQHSVQLSGEINTQSDTRTIDYQIGQHQVEISGDILALSDTKIIDYQIGQHQVSLQGDVDVLTEQRQINYQIGQHNVFIYTDEPQKIDSFSMGYKEDPISVAYKTDSFSVQYKD